MPRRSPAGHLLLDIDAPQMSVRQFRAYFGQCHLAAGDLVTERAAELSEVGGFLALLPGAAILGQVGNGAHAGEQADAPFEILAHLFPPGSKAEFPVLAHCVAALASLRVEHKLSQFLLALVGGDHSVQGCSGLLRRGLRLGFGLRQQQNRRHQGRGAQRSLQAPPPGYSPGQGQADSQEERGCAGPPPISRPAFETRHRTIRAPRLEMDHEGSQGVVRSKRLSPRHVL